MAVFSSAVSSTEKHVNFFALEQACQKEGCPLCTIINERIYRYIDGMLFEHVSDRTFRAQYRAAGGFCTEHSGVLLSYRDGLAAAILGQGILEDYLTDFKKRKIRKFKAQCPACTERDHIESDFLTFLADADRGDEAAQVRSFFTASQGLCVPHYARAITLRKRLPRWLVDFQEGRFKSLLDRTARFIDCSAWGRQADFAALSDADKVVWKELGAALIGHCKPLQ